MRDGRRAAALALQHPPAVAPWRQPGAGGQQRDDQLAGAWPLHPGGEPVFADRPPGAVDQLQPDPPPRFGAAEAEPSLALAAGAAQRQAEVGAGGALAIRQEIELGQRHRRRGPHGEDQVLPRLQEPGTQQGGPSRRPAGAGAPWGAGQGGEGDAGDTEDLAGAGYGRVPGLLLYEACPY